MNRDELIEFENEIASIFEQGKIHGPIHLSAGNEDKLISIFKDIKLTDWIFSTWRSHYHALLHGVPKELVKEEILKGNSITLCFPEYRFYTSAIVGGIIPIAVGVAMGIKKENAKLLELCKTFSTSGENISDEDRIKEHIWVFIGDMALETGIFFESFKYATFHNLPITFVIEDNDLSTTTPTRETWGKREQDNSMMKVLDDIIDAANYGTDVSYDFPRYIYYSYKREKYPHTGMGKFVNF